MVAAVDGIRSMIVARKARLEALNLDGWVIQVGGLFLSKKDEFAGLEAADNMDRRSAETIARGIFNGLGEQGAAVEFAAAKGQVLKNYEEMLEILAQ